MPATQLVQELADAAEDVPVEQYAQATSEAALAYMPLGHSEQPVAKAVE